MGAILRDSSLDSLLGSAFPGRLQFSFHEQAIPESVYVQPAYIERLGHDYYRYTEPTWSVTYRLGMVTEREVAWMRQKLPNWVKWAR